MTDVEVGFDTPACSKDTVSPLDTATLCVLSLQLVCPVPIEQVTVVNVPLTETVKSYRFGEFPGVLLVRTCNPAIVPLTGMGGATLACVAADSPMPR